MLPPPPGTAGFLFDVVVVVCFGLVFFFLLSIRFGIIDWPSNDHRQIRSLGELAPASQLCHTQRSHSSTWSTLVDYTGGTGGNGSGEEGLSLLEKKTNRRRKNARLVAVGVGSANSKQLTRTSSLFCVCVCVCVVLSR